jgi:ParB family chromosome partitioning protein
VSGWCWPIALSEFLRVEFGVKFIGMAWTTFPDKTPSREAQALAEQVERDGGHVLALYQEPVGEHWQIFCLLPKDKVDASPYQRDISPTHVKRLTEAVKKLDRFVDPIVAVSPERGVYWTPNGNHRRTALQKLKADYVPAILVAEPAVAFQVLPLNTEKAHNLKEKALEVIRMYRALAESEPSSTEEDWAFQFESAHFITLGLLYEQNKRFAGGAFAPILRRVDKFLKTPLRRGLPEREERADLVRATDEALAVVVAKIKKRGINHPYVKNYVLARTTPLTRARKTLPPFEQTFKKLRENIEGFDASKVRYEDVQRAGIMAMPAAE